jgi:tRNA-dihydrouridine synthase A
MTKQPAMHTYHRLSIAPMMAYTDRHYRYMMRLLTKRCLLYTEMVVASTITHNLNSGFLNRILAFDPCEHPIAIQLGGDDPATLRVAARVAEDMGYDEINLNVGCPSDRVQKGRFGACLMKEPERVAQVLAAMQAEVSVPVTVKHRLGVDDLDRYQDLTHFVDTVAANSDTRTFIVHARKAWLKGLSPAQNRSVPPLKYDFVHQLKVDFPALDIIVNGGIQDLEQAQNHLRHVDGVMIGRAAYYQPEMFSRADSLIFGEARAPTLTTADLLTAMDNYAHRQVAGGIKLSFIAKHLVGLFKNRPGARIWRQQITRLVQDKPKDFDLAEIYRSVFA